MLTNKITNNAARVVAVPSESFGGFTKGKEYIFEHVRNGLYQTHNDNGHLKYEDFGPQSAHLWDGTDWDNAGHFQVTKIYSDQVGELLEVI